MLNVISDAAALFICWLFVSSGVHKLTPENRYYYRELISGYGFNHHALLRSATPILGPILGCIELALGALMLYPALRPLTALGITALLGGYGLMMAYALYQGKRDLDCGCAGPTGNMKISPLLLLRNVFLMAVALATLIPSAGLWSQKGVIIAPAALLSIILYLCSEHWLSNHQKLIALRG